MPLFVPPVGWERATPFAPPPPHLIAYFEPSTRSGREYLAILSAHGEDTIAPGGAGNDERTDPRAADPTAVTTERERYTMCGLPATSVTRRFTRGATVLVTTVRLVARDRTYTIDYVRPAAIATPSLVRTFLRTACIANDELTTQPPGRWIPVDGISRYPSVLYGKWDSPTDVDIRANVTVTIKPYLGTALSLLHAGQNALRRDALHTAFGPVHGLPNCGPDALTQRQGAVVDGVSVAIEHEIVVVAGRAFIANYLRPAAHDDSPAALAALRSLCP